MALERLQRLGLSDKEAKVYLAALEIGAATADEFAKFTNINRSTTYVQLQELLQLGLMSTFRKEKKTYFAAETPHNLTSIIDRKEREVAQQKQLLESFVPELLTRFASTGVRPTVRSFEGREGLLAMRNEVLKTPSKELYIAAAYDNMRGLLTDDELRAFTAKRIKLGISSYVLYSKKGDDIVTTDNQELRRIDSDEFPFESDVYIYDDHVAFASYKETVSGVIIESKPIAVTMRSIFSLIWETEKKKRGA